MTRIYSHIYLNNSSLSIEAAEIESNYSDKKQLAGKEHEKTYHAEIPKL